MCMSYNVICGCLAVQYFSTLPHKLHDFWKKFNEHEMCVSIYFTFFVWNNSHSKKNWVRYDNKCIFVFMSIIVPIYKKSDKTDCSNYRGISPLSSTYKILSNILLSRLTQYAEDIIGVINVDCDATGQLMIINSAFVKYLIKNGNAMKQCISYL